MATVDDRCDACFREFRGNMPYADAADIAAFCCTARIAVVTPYHGVSHLCRHHYREWRQYGPFDAEWPLEGGAA
jgi:hypothetical protein